MRAGSLLVVSWTMLGRSLRNGACCAIDGGGVVEENKNNPDPPSPSYSTLLSPVALVYYHPCPSLLTLTLSPVNRSTVTPAPSLHPRSVRFLSHTPFHIPCAYFYPCCCCCLAASTCIPVYRLHDVRSSLYISLEVFSSRKPRNRDIRELDI